MVNSIILSGMAWASSLKSAIESIIADDRGQDLMEYAVLVGAIALVAGAVLLFGAPFTSDFNAFKTAVSGCINFNGDCANFGG